MIAQAGTAAGRVTRLLRRPYPVLVPIAMLLAGLLLSTTAVTSRGTELRGQQNRLPDLIADKQRSVNELQRKVTSLQGQVDSLTRQEAGSDARVGQAQRSADALAAPVGLTPVVGPAVTVTLSDAPPEARTRPLPPGVRPPTSDDLVVHQQDVQAVVNALWAGGAEAMTIMNERVVATSAVRCVGNTLLLHGKVYSPPFVITALGDPQRLHAALDAAPGVVVYRQYVQAYGLVLDVRDSDHLQLPGYTGPLQLRSRRLP
jgi:uncharacterized protein YlxW (UPF0749 family)